MVGTFSLLWRFVKYSFPRSAFFLQDPGAQLPTARLGQELAGRMGREPTQGSSSRFSRTGAVLLLGLFRIYGSDMPPPQGLPSHPLRVRNSPFSLASISPTVAEEGSVLMGWGGQAPFLLQPTLTSTLLLSPEAELKSNALENTWRGSQAPLWQP